MDLIEPQQAILEMSFKDDRNLTASALSEDGHWIAVADIEEVKLFRVDENVSLQPLYNPIVDRLMTFSVLLIINCCRRDAGY
jgi:hypothetical protein